MADEHWTRQAALYRNEFQQSLGQLIGIITGLIADHTLNDAEIRFLDEWLSIHDAVVYDWPGDIISARVKAVLADGIVTEDERTYLLTTLQDVVGCKPETIATASHVTELAFDDVQAITFQGLGFCLTGNFVYAPREVCENACAMRGAIVKSAVTKRVHYVVVGSLGSCEWKHGSFGTKIAKAIDLRQQGAGIRIVREDVWAAAL
jgi:NAD-dependent DNA ligase